MAGPASASNADPFFLQVKEKFLDFLKQDEDEGIYAKKVQLMLENENRRLVISINHLRVFDTRLATRYGSCTPKPKHHCSNIRTAFWMSRRRSCRLWKPA